MWSSCSKYIFLSVFGATGLLLAGCASTQKLPAGATVPPNYTIPLAIRTAPPEDIQLPDVRGNVGAHKNAPVRWGGTIQAIENKEQGTWLEIEERELDKYGKPAAGSPSDGRFVAQINDSLDSTIYAPGREITVAGPLEGQIEKPSSSLPLVETKEHYLWDRDDYSYFPRHDRYRYYPHRYDRYYPHRYYRYGFDPYYPFGFRRGYGYRYGPHHGFPFGYGYHRGFHFGLHHGF